MQRPKIVEISRVQHQHCTWALSLPHCCWSVLSLPRPSHNLSHSLCRCTTYAYDCYPRITSIAPTRPGSFDSNTYSADRVGLTLSPLKTRAVEENNNKNLIKIRYSSIRYTRNFILNLQDNIGARQNIN